MTFAATAGIGVLRGVAIAERASPRADWLARSIVFGPLVAATLLAKLSPPIPGMPPVGIVIPLSIVLLALGLATRRLEMVQPRLMLFLVMLSVIGLVHVWRTEEFSLTSFAFMAALGLNYVVAARAGSVSSEDALRFFGNLSFAIAAMGIVQFALQFVGGVAVAFPIDTFLPKAYLTPGYNNLAHLYWGSPIYKATGFVMLEPSVFCQLCALGVVTELSGKGRNLRLAIYAAAIAVSYSGTGLVVLAVTLPVFVVMERRWDLVLRGLLFLAVAALFAEPLHLDHILRRTGEFGAEGSSAFARFVGWKELFADRLWTSPTHALFGYGAGSYEFQAAGYKSAQMAHTKIILEFGVLGALLYFGFIFYCFFTSRAPVIVRIALAVTYFMNGAYSPSVTGFALSLLLWPSPHKDDAPDIANDDVAPDANIRRVANAA